MLFDNFRRTSVLLMFENIYSCTSPLQEENRSLALYKINTPLSFTTPPTIWTKVNQRHACRRALNKIKLAGNQWIKNLWLILCPYSSIKFNFTWAPSTVYFQCQVPLSIMSSLIGSKLTTKPDGQQETHSGKDALHKLLVQKEVKIEANF